MLDFASDPILTQDRTPVTVKASTVFDSMPWTQPPETYTPNRGDVFVMDKTRDMNPSLGDTVELPYGGQIIDTYTANTGDEVQYPIDQVIIGKKQSQVPDVLGLDTTNKTSLGVYEAPAPVRASTPLIDATLLNNPALENLQNFRTDNFSSPLGANYADNRSVIGSGQDAVGFYNNLTQADVTPPVAPETPQDAAQQTPTKPSDCAWYDIPCMFQTIKGEVTVLIVGVVILAVGIFALTR